MRKGGREGAAEVAAGDGSVCAAITYCSIATISQPPTIRISHQCCIMEQITGLRIYCYSSEDAKCGCMSNKRESQPLDFPGNRTGKRQALYHKALTGASSFQFLLFCVCTLCPW